ncbi:hypothetical protein QYF36_014932 [Acer negundo]|nr:hypothetical protein QYF36_014932 [Acer negundo]
MLQSWEQSLLRLWILGKGRGDQLHLRDLEDPQLQALEWEQDLLLLIGIVFAFLYVGQQLLLGGYLDLSEVIAMPLPLGFDLDLLLLEQGNAIADRLAEHPLPAYEPMRTDFPDEEESAGWNMFFDGASNQKEGLRNRGSSR